MSEQAAPPIAGPQGVGGRAVKERGACGGAAVDELAERSEAWKGGRVVRVFNHWLSGRKAAFFVPEERALVLALLAGMSFCPVAHPLVSAGHGLGAAVLRAAIAALAFAVALYFGDLS